MLSKVRSKALVSAFACAASVLTLACASAAPPAPSAPATEGNQVASAAPSQPATQATVQKAIGTAREAPANSDGRDGSPPSSERNAKADEAPSSATAGELPKGTVVLHIGDSFAEALGRPLSKRFEEAGIRSKLEYKTASYIPNWASNSDVPRLVAKLNPDLVLITLGGNELEIGEPEQRASAIKRLIAHFAGRPCVWIAPPLWKRDTGLLQVIRDNAKPCRYLDTNALVTDLPRARDKIHPNLRGREIWADVVLKWLTEQRAATAEKPWALRAETAE